MGFCKCKNSIMNFVLGNVYQFTSIANDGVHMLNDSNEEIILEDRDFYLNFDIGDDCYVENDLCKGCKHGKVFKRLAECPVCHSGSIIGNCITHNLFCVNGCQNTPMAASFATHKNCMEAIYYQRYSVRIISELTKEQILSVSKYLGISASRAYQENKEKSFIIDDIAYENIKEVYEYLDNAGIEYVTDPSLPIISRYDECIKNSRS